MAEAFLKHVDLDAARSVHAATVTGSARAEGA
jgi:hypothetical protein